MWYLLTSLWIHTGACDDLFGGTDTFNEDDIADDNGVNTFDGRDPAPQRPALCEDISVNARDAGEGEDDLGEFGGFGRLASRRRSSVDLSGFGFGV